VILVWRKRNIEKKLSPCCSSVYYYNGAQRYEQFLQVSQLYRALILVGLAPCLPSAFVSRSSWCYIHILTKNFLASFFYFLVSWAWWDWPLTWLINHRPSVLWHCWLGHLTHKSSPKWPIMCQVGCYTLLYHIIFSWSWYCCCYMNGGSGGDGGGGRTDSLYPKRHDGSWDDMCIQYDMGCCQHMIEIFLCNRMVTLWLTASRHLLLDMTVERSGNTFRLINVVTVR